jgi:23S rRNA (adenine1618-N6)-methyltransferase
MKACTGVEVEMVTSGGEVAFVKKMIEESLQLRDRIQWYTSMLGKLSSINVLVEMLLKHENHNFAVTEFEQGSKTKRWAIAWSWGDRRPAMVSRIFPPIIQFTLVFCIPFLTSDIEYCAGNPRLPEESFALPFRFHIHATT